MAASMRYLFLATVALILLGASAQSSKAQAQKFVGVNPFCKTATYRRICTRMVGDATTLNEASANAMVSAKVLATRVGKMVPLLKAVMSHLAPATQESIIKTCSDDFESIVDDMDVSLEALKIGDIGSVRSHLSGALRSDCKEALKEFGADFPLNKYSKQLTMQVDNCFAVVLQN